MMICTWALIVMRRHKLRRIPIGAVGVERRSSALRPAMSSPQAIAAAKKRMRKMQEADAKREAEMEAAEIALAARVEAVEIASAPATAEPSGDATAPT